jgi:hypothetical protein
MAKRHSAYDMGISSAEVIARRMPTLWWNMMSPTAASNAEVTKMVVEKQMAFAETCLAVQTELIMMMAAPWAAGGADRLMQAALGPSAKRVKANVKRLRR